MASSCADTLRMEVPEAPAGPIRPTLAVVLAIFVGLFSLAFGLGALVDTEGDLAPIVRVLMPAALLVAPLAVGVLLRRLGVWTAILGASLASGAVLVVCAPVAMMSAAGVGAVVLLGGIVAMLGTASVVVRERTDPSVPPRQDV